VPDDALDAALDELYAADPSEFVAVRKQLAAGLRASGDKADAQVLAAARRPSTAAAALNQLARREPEIVERLLERSSELVAVQTRLQSGRSDVLRDAIRAHREALDAATVATIAILGERANDGFRNEIVATLRAASTDDDVSRQLRAGRLVREPEPTSGFPETIGLTLVSEPPPAAAKPARQPKAKTAGKPAPEVRRDAKSEREQARAAAAAEAEAKVQREQARRARDAAREEVKAAEAEVEQAQARVAALESDLGAARDEHREARARLRAAKAEAARHARDA
jgi:hypothetical protein